MMRASSVCGGAMTTRTASISPTRTVSCATTGTAVSSVPATRKAKSLRMKTPHRKFVSGSAHNAAIRLVGSPHGNASGLTHKP